VGAPLRADTGPDVQYHMGDHLDSSHIAVGGSDSKSSVFTNREEFFPYGETSFGSFARKRYRYVGRERDEESGLGYHGARYYAAWLARWVSTDPDASERRKGWPYAYSHNNPMSLTDPGGRAPISQEPYVPDPTGVQVPGLQKSRAHLLDEFDRTYTTRRLFEPEEGAGVEGYADFPMQFNIDRGTFLGTGDTHYRIRTIGAAKGFGLTGQVWAEGFEEYTLAVGPLNRFSLHIEHQTTMEQLDRILAGVERGSFNTTVLGRHLETAASRVGLTIGNITVEDGPMGEYYVTGAFRRPGVGFPGLAPTAGFLLLSALDNSPVASGGVHVEDGLDEEFAWGLRWLVAGIRGKPGPPLPPHIQRQNEANDAAAAQRAIEAAQRAIEWAPDQRLREQIRQWGLEGAGHSL